MPRLVPFETWFFWDNLGIFRRSNRIYWGSIGCLLGEPSKIITFLTDMSDKGGGAKPLSAPLGSSMVLLLYIVVIFYWDSILHRVLIGVLTAVFIGHRGSNMGLLWVYRGVYRGVRRVVYRGSIGGIYFWGSIWNLSAVYQRGLSFFYEETL